jgi:DNA-binding SARP family transcriptional activator
MMERSSRRLTAVTARMIRVLGPVDVLTEDGVRSVGGRRPQMLLAALVLTVGHATSTDHLADVLWAGDPPDHAANTLQSYISRLRHILGPDIVRAVDGSYLLEVEIEELDALLFERLVRRARAETDPELVRKMSRDALRLWRGVPFGDLSREDPFRMEAIRLDELRVLAMELGLEAELALGRGDLVVGELQAAVRENPYRERLWHLLVEALARDGRRVEALRACTDLRTLLAEVGLEPGDHLETLEDRILAGEEPDHTLDHR